MRSRFIEEVTVVPAPELSAPDPLVASAHNLRDTVPELSPLAGHDAGVFESPAVTVPSSGPSSKALLTGNTLLFASLVLAIVSAAALALRHQRLPTASARGLWTEHQITTNDIEVPVEAVALGSQRVSLELA